MRMFFVDTLFEKYKKNLHIKLIAGSKGLQRRIYFWEVQRPGLCLTGYFKSHSYKRMLLFGKAELQYLRDLVPKERNLRLKEILTPLTPAVFVSRNLRPVQELIHLCEEKKIPLFRSSMMTMNLMSKLMHILMEEFAPTLSCHGCFVEVFGVGVLIQGDSAVGKSEAALGLIERGHRLISDDIVRVKKKEGDSLEGYGAEISKHHMEVRGIGIINVANLYGAVCVSEKKTLDIVVKLEVWDDTHFYDRVGLDEKTIEMLGVSVPYHLLPVKPGRDVVLLLETLALNHRLKKMGYHSAKEFNAKLLAAIAKKENGKGKRK